MPIDPLEKLRKAREEAKHELESAAKPYTALANDWARASVALSAVAAVASLVAYTYGDAARNGDLYVTFEIDTAKDSKSAEAQLTAAKEALVALLTDADLMAEYSRSAMRAFLRERLDGVPGRLPGMIVPTRNDANFSRGNFSWKDALHALAAMREVVLKDVK